MKARTKVSDVQRRSVKPYDLTEEPEDELREIMRRVTPAPPTGGAMSSTGTAVAPSTPLELLKDPDFWSVLNKQARAALDPSRPTDGPMLPFVNRFFANFNRATSWNICRAYNTWSVIRR